MFRHLIIRNVKRNISTYTIYFITLIMIYGLIYGFNSIASSPLFNNLSETQKIINLIVKQGMGFLTFIVTIAFAFLVIYATTFVLKRRSKELGLYASLGLNNSQINKIIFLELLLVNAFSLIAGILLGYIISILLTFTLKLTYGIENNIQLSYLSIKALVITLVSFSVILFITSIINHLKFKKMKIVKLLNSETQVLPKISLSPKINNVLFIIGMVSFIVWSIYLYQQEELTVIKNQGILLVIWLLLSASLIYLTLGNFTINIFKNNRKYYYRDTNDIIIRKLGNNVSKNSIALSISALFLSLSFIIILAGGSAYIAMLEKIKQASPVDLSVMSEYRGIDNEIESTLNKDGINLEKTFSKTNRIIFYKSNFKYKEIINDTEKLWRLDKPLLNNSVPIMKVSDYNKALEMKNQPPITLGKSEYFFNCNYNGTIDFIKKYASDKRSINLNGIDLIPSKTPVRNNVFVLNTIGVNDRGTIVVPDHIATQLPKGGIVFNGIYNEKINRNNIDSQFNKWVLKYYDGNSTFKFKYQSSDRMRELFVGVMGTIIIIGTFIGVVFSIISLCILSIQTTTDAIYFKKDFGIMKAMGIPYKLIRKTIMIQITLYFLTPCIIAIPLGVVIGRKIIDVFEDFMNFKMHFSPVVLVVQVVIFAIYIIATYILYKKTSVNK
ncbi:FtsX-like permease family protein [Staphylococcus simulans]